ncbi:hypothetical protein MASR2M8_05830 [Opitutaceae bacterium]
MNALRHHAPLCRPSGLRPLRGLVLLLAWLCATGTHWDLVQVAAWTRMWYRAAQTESVAAALDATFAPSATCSLCAVADEGRAAAGDPATDDLLRNLGRPVLLAWEETDIPTLMLETENHARVWSAQFWGLMRVAPPAPPPRGRPV